MHYTELEQGQKVFTWGGVVKRFDRAEVQGETVRVHFSDWTCDTFPVSAVFIPAN